MTFERLRPSDWVVFVAALALLFTTAPDWYSTTRGEEARQIQKQARSNGGQEGRDVERDAGVLAESQERNAWQEDALIDRIILIALLATSALGVGAAFWRASGRGARDRSDRAPGFAALGESHFCPRRMRSIAATTIASSGDAAPFWTRAKRSLTYRRAEASRAW